MNTKEAAKSLEDRVHITVGKDGENTVVNGLLQVFRAYAITPQELERAKFDIVQAIKDQTRGEIANAVRDACGVRECVTALHLLLNDIDGDPTAEGLFDPRTIEKARAALAKAEGKD